MDNFKIIYKILNALEKGMDLEQFDTSLLSCDKLKVSQERLNKYLIMLYEVGYIKGINAHQWIDGSIEIEMSQIDITLKGLEYLAENSIMQKLYNTAKGVRDLI